MPRPASKRQRRDEMGTLLNGKPRQFPLFVEAAMVLHSMTKDSSSTTCFPKLYTIPSEEPWPMHLRGVKLNTAQVRMHYKNGNLHPDTLAALQSINFVFDVNEVKWAQKIAALQIYKELNNGDLCVPQDYRIPSNDDRWPRDVWGMRLGLAVRSIRQKTRPNSERYEQLTAMGFVWNVLDMGWETKRIALATYKQIHGDLLVAYSFTVPTDDDRWPKETWGLKLGHAVHNIRQNGHDMSAERHQQLYDLGFVWDHLESSWDVKVTALRMYKHLYGHVIVPYGFVVPGEGSVPLWPRETWGMKLGHAVHNMRQNIDDMPEARRMLLNALGFAWHSTPLTWDMKLRALQIYHELEGHLNIPEEYRIPADDSIWPKKTWHVRLAEAVEDLRKHAHKLSSSQVAALDELGFDWKDSRGGDDAIERISICDGFPLVKRLRLDCHRSPASPDEAILCQV